MIETARDTRRPQTNTTADNYKRMDETHKQYAHNAYAMTSKASLFQYLHQAEFSPPKATLLKELHDNQFVTWPGLTVKAVKNSCQNPHQQGIKVT